MIEGAKRRRDTRSRGSRDSRFFFKTRRIRVCDVPLDIHSKNRRANSARRFAGAHPDCFGLGMGMLVADKIAGPIRQATAIALVSVGALAAVPLLVKLALERINRPESERGSRNRLRSIRGDSGYPPRATLLTEATRHPAPCRSSAPTERGDYARPLALDSTPARGVSLSRSCLDLLLRRLKVCASAAPRSRGKKRSCAKAAERRPGAAAQNGSTACARANRAVAR